MSSVPSLKAKDVIKAFQHMGWIVARQKGSHIIMVKEGEIASLSVPNHNPVARGTLRTLIRSANITVQDFINSSK